MSAPVVELSAEQRARIEANEREIGRLTLENIAIRRGACVDDGIAPQWLEAHR